jgi:hypothetical protein
MIMRTIHRRRLTRALNASTIILLGAVLFTPKMDSWPTSPDLVITLFAPIEATVAH